MGWMAGVRLPSGAVVVATLIIIIIKVKVKISLLQAVEAHRVARGQGSHIT
jgi:hypothetical protein